MIYRDAYQNGVALLSGAGLRNATNEAMWLLESLGISRVMVYANAESPVSPQDWERAHALFHRRVSHEPLQYLLGSQEFRGRAFMVEPGVFIPRPETELLVEEVLASPLPPSPIIADIGTGSGCLAVSLALECPQAVLYAIDCSELALTVARRNAERYGVHDRLTFLVGDVLTPLVPLELKGCVSVIVANPPYIPTSHIAGLPPVVRDFEPVLSLDGGIDGLVCFRQILSAARSFLEPSGHLVMEMGQGQADSVCQEAICQGGWTIHAVRQDHAGIDRVVSLVKR